MAISNCARCNRMYQRGSGGKLCPLCIEEEENAFRSVRTYLEDHPGESLDAVASGSGVDQAMILRLLQDGRLATLDDLASGIAIPCRQCGKPTTWGKSCQDCADQLGAALKSSAEILGEQADRANLRLRRPETIQEKRRGI